MTRQHLKWIHPAHTLTFVAFFLLIATYSLIPSASRIMAYSDDALFYGVIANNFVQGHGFSFDGGFSHTNGFHWAQMIVSLVSAGAYHLLDARADFHQFLPFNFFVDLVVLAVCSLLIIHLFQVELKKPYHRAVVLFFVSQALSMGFGTEQVILVTVAVGLTVKLFKRNVRVSVAGFLAFVVVLARIDMAWLPAMALIVSTMARAHFGLVRRNNSSTLFVGIFAGTILGVATVFCLNALAAGDVRSSSWIAKSAQAKWHLEEFVQNVRLTWQYFAVFLAVLSVTLVQRKYVSRSPIVALQFLTSIMGSIMLLSLIGLRSLGGNNLGPWYDVGWTTFLLVSLSLLFISWSTKVHSRLRWVGFVVILFCIAIVVPAENVRLRLGSQRQEIVAYYQGLSAVGDSVRIRVDPQALIGVDDLPGRFTYYTQRRIVALDGLANSPEYVINHLANSFISSYVESNLDYVIALQELHIKGGDHRVCITLGFPFNKNFKQETWCVEREQVIFQSTLSDTDVARWPIMLITIHKKISSICSRLPMGSISKPPQGSSMP